MSSEEKNPDAPAVPAVRRAVVAGHGDFAAGIISAVEQIAGKGSAFRAVSNRELSAVALEEMLRATVEANDARVIFTDLPAGSCTIAARRVARDTPGLIVVTGANLSVLIGWAMAPDDSGAAYEHAIERGRAAMVLFPATVSPEVNGAR
jgi:PTS system N-acetylgalactosamine-specific IIA component